MKNRGGVGQTITGLLIVAGLIVVLVLAFRGISSGPGAAPAATGETGYPAPAQTPSGYPAPRATEVGSPYPTPSNVPTMAPTSALSPLADSPDQFDPKTYGLPDTIAGYKVLGVVTSENEACVPPGRKILLLQTTDPTVQDYLKNFRQADVMKAMGEMGLNTPEWNISVGGPSSTREQLVAGVQAWNHDREKYGCVQSVPPPTISPNSTP